MPEKIRPLTREQIRAQEEGGLPEMATAPDPGGVRPEHTIGALNATQAAAARATHDEPNRLGRTFKPNEAEQLLTNYQAKRTAWKAEYAATRREGGPAEEEYYAARGACVAAGLLDPNS